MNDYPMAEVIKIVAKKNHRKVVVLCPYCEEHHSHGASATDTELHRVADCYLGTYYVPLEHFNHLLVLPRVPSPLRARS